jgi:hypothetical protein
MRNRRIAAVIVLICLGAGVAVFLLTQDSGPSMVVQGNFSAKDVAQIKSAVRRELWREAFPNFSWNAFKGLPHGVKLAFKAHVTLIQAIASTAPNGKTDFLATLSQPFDSSGLARSYILTNGPYGWVCRGYLSYSPSAQ